jgi:glycosyltransferase involved in cell wall biosynthesis
MKTAPFLNASSTKETSTSLSPFKVCMHVLGCARTDMRVLREAKTLASNGFVVSIVDIDGKGICPIEEDIQGICVKHILMPRSFMTTRFKKRTGFRAVEILILSIFRLIQTPADFYHAHDMIALPACYIAALIRRKPLIFDAHELPLSETWTRKVWLHISLVHLLTFIVKRCAGVITVSEPIAKEIQKRFRAQQITLVRNIPAYQVFSKGKQLRQYLRLDPEVRIALYQGIIDRSRRLDILIRASAFLENDIVIILMGKDMWGTSDELEALAAKEGVTNRIRIIPPVPYEELLGWTSSADIGLIIYTPDYSLNVQMCLPNKLFEYLMAGLPILATELDAVSDIIKEYDVGQIVHSVIPADIGRAINRLLGNPSAQAQMRLNALRAVQSDLCWEKEEQRLIGLYHLILNQANLRKR